MVHQLAAWSVNTKMTMLWTDASGALVAGVATKLLRAASDTKQHFNQVVTIRTFYLSSHKPPVFFDAPSMIGDRRFALCG